MSSLKRRTSWRVRRYPWGLDALQGAATDPAWKSKPSFYLVATQDGMIPPPAQRMMAERAGATVREEAGSQPSTSPNPSPWRTSSKLPQAEQSGAGSRKSRRLTV